MSCYIVRCILSTASVFGAQLMETADFPEVRSLIDPEHPYASNIGTQENKCRREQGEIALLSLSST